MIAQRLALLLLVSCTGSAVAAPDMVRVPGGQATIGSDRGRPDEGPAFNTAVAAFELDRTPVTVAAFGRYVQRSGVVTDAERLGSGAVMRFGTGQWSLVSGANWRKPYGPDAEAAKADHPVTQVSWNDASAYCAAIGKRLPSEIEFEYASRAGQRSGPAHAFGDELVKDGHYRANVWTGVFPLINTAKDGYRTTSPVGAFGANALGLEDLAGNVWEWTSDWYRPYSQRNQPAPTDSRAERVQRGGSYLCDPTFCYGFKVTARGHATADSSLMHVGFRCARDLIGRSP